jgi:2-polyprenyl-3-methyl-5-hydroxy-6-metoxy-1,4-benzoquinol methylase
MQNQIQCWCENKNLHDYSPEYFICKQCTTLISKTGFKNAEAVITNDEQDFYGKNYWLNHQTERYYLSERCLYWLQNILHYHLPPAKVLEVGSGHGGFVKILRETGFEATGLELSPFIAKYARNTFDVPVLEGPIEKQAVPQASLDMIILMDVLEHLPDPKTTIQACLKLLNETGCLIMQTPCFPDLSFKKLTSKKHAFLEMMQAQEHLYLFSKVAVQTFFKTVTQEQLYFYFEPAIFSQYDMFFMVSRKELTKNSEEQIDKALSMTPNSRLIQALLDTAKQRDTYIKLYQQADKDRIARLEEINRLTQLAHEGIGVYKPIL